MSCLTYAFPMIKRLMALSLMRLCHLLRAAAYNLGPTVFPSSIHVESILNGDNTTYTPAHMVDSLWKANNAGGE